MSCHMPRNLLLYAAQLHYLFDGSENRAVFGHGEYLAAFAHALVLLINHLGNVEQLNLRQDRRFLAGDMNPLVVVEIRTDIIVREIIQFAIGQARKRIENYQCSQKRNTANKRQFVVIQQNCVVLHSWVNSKHGWNNEPVQLPSHYLFSFHLDAVYQGLNCQRKGFFIREPPFIQQI